MTPIRLSLLVSLGRAALNAAAWGGVLAAAVFAVRASAAESTERSEALERFHTQLEFAMRTGEFVGLSVAVIEHGEITFLESYGETEVGSGDVVTSDTVFRFASVSKGFASALVGQLAEEGRLSWSDPVTRYDPEFRLKTTRATNAVTLENIASHRVGLPAHAYDNLLEHGYRFDNIVHRLSRTDLVCAPGDCYQYQNVAYSLLAPAVESADGRSYADAVEARIFEPLGMSTASVGLEGLKSSDSWARGHARRRVTSPWYSFEPNENYYRVAPAGGLNGSIEDLALWARAQMGYNDDVLNSELRNEVQSARVDTPQENRKMRWMRSRLRDADYALGWRVYDYSGERMVMHAGGVSGYRALVAFMPEREVGMVALWNAGNSRGWRILPTFFDAYLDLGPTDWLGVEEMIMAEQGAGADQAAYGSP